MALNGFIGGRSKPAEGYQETNETPRVRQQPAAGEARSIERLVTDEANSGPGTLRKR